MSTDNTEEYAIQVMSSLEPDIQEKVTSLINEKAEIEKDNADLDSARRKSRNEWRTRAERNSIRLAGINEEIQRLLPSNPNPPQRLGV